MVIRASCHGLCHGHSSELSRFVLWSVEWSGFVLWSVERVARVSALVIRVVRVCDTPSNSRAHISFSRVSFIVNHP